MRIILLLTYAVISTAGFPSNCKSTDEHKSTHLK